MTRPTIEEVVAALYQMIWIVMHKAQGVDTSKDDRFLKADRIVQDFFPDANNDKDAEKDEIITESINKLQSDLELAKSGLSEAKCYCMFISNKFDDICKKLGVE